VCDPDEQRLSGFVDGQTKRLRPSPRAAPPFAATFVLHQKASNSLRQHSAGAPARSAETGTMFNLLAPFAALGTAIG